MNSKVRAVMMRHHQGGLLLDTNVLLLFLAAKVDPTSYRAWKRLGGFTDEHLVLMLECIQLARQRMVTTPHILAEVGTFSEYVPPRFARRFWSEFDAFVRDARERWRYAARLLRDSAGADFDLADIGIVSLPWNARPVVMTVDAPLCGLLEKRKLPFINPNHHLL